ncbi:hypothetical protein FHS83_002235 [Rhizomicrobium palustre]|uniref:PEP-CTERM protein-sorting domain-containing protein n=1 Tax=Rhizomicrobium palustre TaxID=189966 RepID=A0A846N179_9PROT|nr:hypothetical protein [Rhizomicrobium palustre]NIK88917.1 hypothetical protein [Rhizomicrobium palustre]
MRNALLAAAATTMLSAGLANATPITTPPPPLIAMGDVKAVYVFANAMNTSLLDETSPNGWSSIFCNHHIGSCPGNHAGDIKDLGSQSGALTFRLRNTSTGKSYWSDTADSNGNYHAVFSTDYSSFGIGSLPSGAASALAGLSNVTFVAWEDRDATNGSDFDYNDLVFAFSNTSATGNPGIPEPLSLSFLGAGLLGLAALRAKRRKI